MVSGRRGVRVGVPSRPAPRTPIMDYVNLGSTGLKVSSALDDASTFAVAQGLRGDIKGYNAVNQALGAAKGFANVALSAATSISNKMQDIKAKLVQLSDESISAATRNAIFTAS